jgi:hypothetical protein
MLLCNITPQLIVEYPLSRFAHRNHLFCIAVSVGDFEKGVHGAISLSFLGEIPDAQRQAHPAARARRIGERALKSEGLDAHERAVAFASDPTG